MPITPADFAWDEFFWKTRVMLPPALGLETGNAEGSVDLVFAPEGRDEGPLTGAEIALVQWLLDHREGVVSAVLAALVASYPDLQAAEDLEDEERRELMPDLRSPEDLRELIRLESVNVHPLSVGDAPYIGFEFDCRWDEEHGLGVLMHGERVVEIGGADTAIYLWIAEQDAERR
ncbi:MAG: hypothetical protein QNK04_02255 [Myxococcota bacterium]|nr:hypothetical protein [Myxococcota bacterium]